MAYFLQDSVDGGALQLPRTGTIQGTETILVVEDTEDLRKMICHVLTQNGYTVLEASNGMEALQVTDAYRNPIHLVLTDVVMPKMDGGELAERLLLTNPRQRLIFMSGYADNIALNGLERLAAFLAKPFTSTALVRKIREVLDSPTHHDD